MFAKHLREEGDKFRREVLKSDDERDATVMDADWTKNQKKEGTAKGGPYLAVHMRRADFLYAHPDGVPSLDNAVKQIKEILKKEKLEMVFLATDADKEGDSLTILAANYHLISRSIQNSFSVFGRKGFKRVLGWNLTIIGAVIKF